MKKQNVENLFNNISAKYDIANRFISLGIEKIWRKKFSNHIAGSERYILDACCGTGFSTFDIISKIKAKNFKVYGVDFSEEMLAVARSRLANIKKNMKDSSNFDVEFMKADVTNLNFNDDYFDVISIVFGIRNIFDRKKALEEFLRVAKPGGRLIIMEFNLPENPLFRKPYSFYMNRILVNIGAAITKNRKAYEYLVDTIRYFPSADSFASLMESIGWINVSVEKLTFGTCTIFTAVKR